MIYLLKICYRIELDLIKYGGKTMKNEILKYLKLFLGLFICSLGVISVVHRDIKSEVILLKKYMIHR
jgi:hypothetical protein